MNREYFWLVFLCTMFVIYGLVQEPWKRSTVLKSVEHENFIWSRNGLQSRAQDHNASKQEIRIERKSLSSDLLGPWDYNRTLYLSPYTGLANTLQAAASAFTIGRREGFNVKIVFNSSPQQFGPASWEELFDEPKLGFFNSSFPDGRRSDAYTKACKVLPPIFKWKDLKGDWEKYDEHSEILCLSSCCWQEPPFPESSLWFYEMMTPAPQLSEIIASFKASVQWDRYQWVGVHVRRSDNMQVMRNLIKMGPLKRRINYNSTDDDDILPISNYIDRMRDINNSVPTYNLAFYQSFKPVRYFLATDNPSAVKQVVSSFSSGMVVQVQKEDLNKIRSSVSGMQSSIVDLFLLASCEVLIGTPYSTFSATASYMRKKLYVEPEFKYIS